MATVSAPRSRRSVAESQQHVHHPLQRVGGLIRRYVTLEVVATLCLYLALWVWLCMALDYGIFKAFGIDWADIGTPRWPRAMVLGTLLAGVLLFVEFGVHRRILKRMGNALAKHKSPLGIILEVLATVAVFGTVIIVPDMMFWLLGAYTAAVIAVGLRTQKFSGYAAWGGGLGAACVYLLAVVALQAMGHSATLIGLDSTSGGTLAWSYAALLIPLVPVLGYALYNHRLNILTAALLLILGLWVQALSGLLGFVILAALALLVSYNFLRLAGLNWLPALLLSPLFPIYLTAWVLFSVLLDAGAFGAYEAWIVGALGLMLLVLMFAAMVLRRMMYDFAPTQLALLLERRFPDVLGDRLITAVELSDVKAATRLGYSSEMIEHTIVDAADRVDQVPVAEVFNWGRLTRLGLVVALLTVGTYLLVLGGSGTAANLAGSPVSAGMTKFHDVAGTWFERNNLLQNEPWPRRAHLEVLGFDKGEIRISQETVEHPIHVRALKWAWADADAVRGYRALTIADLESPELLGEAPELPAGWRARHPDWTVDQVDLEIAGMNLDTLLQIHNAVQKQDEFTKLPNVTREEANGKTRLVIRDGVQNRVPYWKELQELTSRLGEGAPEMPALPSDWIDKRVNDLTLEQVEGQLAGLELGRVQALQGVLTRLDEIVVSDALKRQLRKFVVPPEVIVIARGKKTYNRLTLKPEGENTFGGKFSDIKESFEFRAYGEDFASRPYRVTLVPPPGLEELSREEYHPAYLYYRVPVGQTVEAIKGKKQFFAARPMSLAGTVSSIPVPVGADVELIARGDKDLVDVTVRRTPGSTQAGAVGGPLPTIRRLDETLDPETGQPFFRRFRVRFDNVRGPQDVTFDFLDTDNVKGRRRVVINPQPERAPDVSVMVEVIRKTPQGYMITPVARVPFSGKVLDDRGLDRVNYACTLQKLAGPSQAQDQTLGLIALPLRLAGGMDLNLTAAARLVEARRQATKPDDDESAGPQTVPVRAFERARQDRKWKETPDADKLPVWLKEGPPADVQLAELYRDHTFEPKDPTSSFALSQIGRNLKAPEGETQIRYKMILWVEAFDTDVETGPNKGENKERYPFVIVSEYELLTEIAKEEEGLFIKLDDLTNKLRDSVLKLAQMRTDLNATNLKAEAFGPMSVRSEDIWQIIDKNAATVSEVILDYERIIEEEEINGITETMIDKLRHAIRDPLIRIRNGSFPNALEGMDQLRMVVDNKETPPQDKTALARAATLEAENRLVALIQKLEDVLNSMEGIAGLNTLIKQIRDIEEEQQKQYDIFAELHAKMKKDLTKGLFEDEDQPKK